MKKLMTLIIVSVIVILSGCGNTQEIDYELPEFKGTHFDLPEIPYPVDGLEPYYSAKTLHYHYGKHHLGYTKNINNLIEGTDYEAMNIEEIIIATANNPTEQDIFNNAAQYWNHTFFWNGMIPAGGGAPTGDLLKMIENSFGSFEKMKEEFKSVATSQFGSGWAWLVQDGDKLKVMSTANAKNPLADGYNPLLTIDVWEHAYYLDYQNERGTFVDIYFDNLVNWTFAMENLE